jgi:hypothetical protein
MNLGGIWEWEKLKLSSDIDFSEKYVGFSDVPLEREEEDEDLPPAIKAQRRAAASLGAVNDDVDSCVILTEAVPRLIPVVEKLPYRRRLDVKLEGLKVPEKIPKMKMTLWNINRQSTSSQSPSRKAAVQAPLGRD